MNISSPARLFLKKVAITSLLGGVLISAPYCLTAFSAAQAETQDVGMNCSEIKTFFRGLQLTADQRTQLQTIAATHQTTLATDRLAVKTANAALSTFLNGGGNDATQIDALTSADAAAIKTLQVELSNIFIESYAVLTEVQKAQLLARSTNSSGSGRGVHRRHH